MVNSNFIRIILDGHFSGRIHGRECENCGKVVNRIIASIQLLILVEMFSKFGWSSVDICTEWKNNENAAVFNIWAMMMFRFDPVDEQWKLIEIHWYRRIGDNSIDKPHDYYSHCPTGSQKDSLKQWSNRNRFTIIYFDSGKGGGKPPHKQTQCPKKTVNIDSFPPAPTRLADYLHEINAHGNIPRYKFMQIGFVGITPTERGVRKILNSINCWSESVALFHCFCLLI